MIEGQAPFTRTSTASRGLDSLDTTWQNDPPSTLWGETFMLRSRRGDIPWKYTFVTMQYPPTPKVGESSQLNVVSHWTWKSFNVCLKQKANCVKSTPSLTRPCLQDQDRPWILFHHVHQEKQRTGLHRSWRSSNKCSCQQRPLWPVATTATPTTVSTTILTEILSFFFFFFDRVNMQGHWWDTWQTSIIILLQLLWVSGWPTQQANRLLSKKMFIRFYAEEH